MARRNIEISLLFFVLGLKEEKNIEYSNEECEKNVAYIFDGRREFYEYFISNGCFDQCSTLDSCIIFEMKNGSIISLKGLCDYTISRCLDRDKDDSRNNVKKLVPRSNK